MAAEKWSFDSMRVSASERAREWSWEASKVIENAQESDSFQR